MSPVSMAGSYSAAVVLYDGSEPVQAAGTTEGVRTQTAFRVGVSVMCLQASWKLCGCCGLASTISKVASAQQAPAQVLCRSLPVLLPRQLCMGCSNTLPMASLRTASKAPCRTCAWTSSLVQEVGQDELEGTVLWKEQLCLERVRLRSTSQVVVEVYHQKEGAFEPEMIAWAHAPIMQVGHACTTGALSKAELRQAQVVCLVLRAHL